MSRLSGCTIAQLDREACQQVLAWITGRTNPTEGGNDLKWLLAYCHDGVTWGKYDAIAWRLSSTAFPDLCPAVSSRNLLEARLFGEKEEIMIWRAGGGFAGRRLADAPERGTEEATRPDDEIRILAGDRLIDGPKYGFSRLATAAGTQQAVPLECAEADFRSGRWPFRLKVRHYFEKNSTTGVVRVGASRLVDVFKEVR